jgi:integrase
MPKAKWPEKVLRLGLARGVINSRIDRIRRAFSWAASEQLVPVGVYQALMTVANLQAGRSEARETERVKPVSTALVQETLPYLPSTIADIVRLLLITGMRAGEAASMKVCEIEMGGPVWLYRPNHHKVAHRGINRTIALGPRAQEVIKPYLKPNLRAYLFSPKEALAAFRAKQRAKRKTPVQPSQQIRKKQKPKKNSRHFPPRQSPNHCQRHYAWPTP